MRVPIQLSQLPAHNYAFNQEQDQGQASYRCYACFALLSGECHIGLHKSVLQAQLVRLLVGHGMYRSMLLTMQYGPVQWGVMHKQS